MMKAGRCETIRPILECARRSYPCGPLDNSHCILPIDDLVSEEPLTCGALFFSEAYGQSSCVQTMAINDAISGSYQRTQGLHAHIEDAAMLCRWPDRDLPRCGGASAPERRRRRSQQLAHRHGLHRAEHGARHRQHRVAFDPNRPTSRMNSGSVSLTRRVPGNAPMTISKWSGTMVAVSPSIV